MVSSLTSNSPARKKISCLEINSVHGVSVQLENGPFGRFRFVESDEAAILERRRHSLVAIM